MKITELTQEYINENLATIDDFWKSFHQSLAAPYCLWNNYKEKTIEQWIEIVRNTPEMVIYLKALFEYPLLKGEFIIGYYKGIMLTNYRLIINDTSAGNPSIPLSNLVSYSENDDGIIKFDKNGQIISLIYSEFVKKSMVDSAKARFLEKQITDVQLFFLSKSIFEIQESNPNFEIQKINFPEQINVGKESLNTQTLNDNAEKKQNNSIKIIKILGLALVISLVVGFIASIFGTLGGGSNYGFVQQEGMNKINSMSNTLGIVVGIITFIFICYKGFKNLKNNS
jgi:hypothetical protein